MKNVLCTTAGVVGGFIASLFEGWDTGIATLVLFMGIDFLWLSSSRNFLK